MALFFLCVALLIGGYFVYGALVDRVFGSDPNRTVPSQALADGVDYVPMPGWKLFLIQLLNIAGLGPIFGPIMGALWGPSCLLWIVAGTIFAGAVHDYFAGMLSVRSNGENVPNIVGRELGMTIKQIMNVFAVILLILVGVVFTLGPAALLAQLSGWNQMALVFAVFAYYFLATILPIDKIIGRLYPLFGALLLFMAISLTVMILISPAHHVLPQGLDLSNLHPKKLPVWPLMFITIACGAVSGFHSTQSPLMARCMANEKNGRFVFYGAMVGEGIIALIWATLSLSFYDSQAALQAAIAKGTASGVVHEVATGLLGGGIGTVLAVLGVVVLPITSGDTAFRAARLTIAEYIKLPQKEPMKRLMIAVPLFVVGYLISLGNFNIIWRYFGWANQTLAMMVLWTGAAWLAKQDKLHWICTVPATFMTAVTVAYICAEKIGFNLPYAVSNWIGIAAAVVAFGAFFYVFGRKKGEHAPAE